MPIRNLPIIKINGAEVNEQFQNAIIEIVVDTSLFMPALAILRLTGADPAAVGVEGNTLGFIDDSNIAIGKPLEIAFKTDERGSRPTTIFKGLIAAVEVDFGRTGAPVLEIRGYDKLSRLTFGKKIRNFVSKKDSDIVRTIAGEASLQYKGDDTSVTHDHLWQYNQSNWDFIVSRARLLGYVIYCENETLCFTDLKKASSVVELSIGTEILSFHPCVSAMGQDQKAKISGFDIKGKQAVVAEDNSDGFATGPSGLGTAKKASSDFLSTESISTIVDVPVTNQSLANLLAKAEMHNGNTFVHAEGECYGNAKIIAGQKITIKKAGQRYSGDYLLTQAQHILNMGGYTVHFTANGFEPETFHSLLQWDEKQPDNRIDGVVTALVTNLNDPDNTGRVKLKFPWLSDNLESWWAPVIIPGGGNERGLAFPPEVNDTVLVSFEHGDINFPVVIGGLWNSKDKPIADLIVSGTVEQRAFRTKVGHTIVFTEKQGEEGITITTKKGHELLMTEQSGSEKISIIDSGGVVKILMDITQKTISIEAQADITVKSSTGAIKLEASAGDVSIKGVNVNLEAQASAKLKANASVTVEGTGTAALKGAQVSVQGTALTEVKGALVKIN